MFVLCTSRGQHNTGGPQRNCSGTGMTNSNNYAQGQTVPGLCGKSGKVILTYHASDMVLAVYSNVSYLSKSKARSCAGGILFMSNDHDDFPSNGVESPYFCVEETTV